MLLCSVVVKYRNNTDFLHANPSFPILSKSTAMHHAMRSLLHRKFNRVAVFQSGTLPSFR